MKKAKSQFRYIQDIEERGKNKAMVSSKKKATASISTRKKNKYSLKQGMYFPKRKEETEEIGVFLVRCDGSITESK
jgi:hypothetical protein